MAHRILTECFGVVGGDITGGNPVDIRGWPEKSTDAQKNAWAKKYSDHAILFFEVQKV